MTSATNKHGERLARLEGAYEHLATKADVETVRSEIQSVRAELKAEIQSVRAELKAEIQALRAELTSKIQSAR